MKKVIAVILMLILVIGTFSLVGCSSDNTTTSTPVETTETTTELTTEQDAPEGVLEKAGFEHILTVKTEGSKNVSIDGSLYYYRELGTDVMYMYYTGYKRAGLTVMMDPETNGPMLYTNWLKYQNEKALEVTE